MQPRDGLLHLGQAAQLKQPESIRDRQRRRRAAQRAQTGIEVVLAAPDDDLDLDDEDAEEEAPTPFAPTPNMAPAKVFVVFRGADWDDPDGALRESDSIAGVYATEDAARRAAAALNNEAAEREDAWYQPYTVQS